MQGVEASKPTTDPPLAVFSTGCLIGMLLSYGNLTGFLAGLLAGVFIQTNGPQLGGSIMNCAAYAADGVFTVVRSLQQKRQLVAHAAPESRDLTT